MKTKSSLFSVFWLFSKMFQLKYVLVRHCLSFFLEICLNKTLLVLFSWNMSSHGTRTCIKRKKNTYGKFFDFCAEKCVYNLIPRDQNPPIRGFWENAFFVFLNLTSEGLKCPQEVQVRHETCSTICGTPVQAIFDQKNLTGLAGGVKEGQNIAQNGPRFYIFLASEPSRGPLMCQGPLKYPQNDPSNCPWLIWVHFRGPWPI